MLRGGGLGEAERACRIAQRTASVNFDKGAQLLERHSRSIKQFMPDRYSSWIS